MSLEVFRSAARVCQTFAGVLDAALCFRTLFACSGSFRWYRAQHFLQVFRNAAILLRVLSGVRDPAQCSRLPAGAEGKQAGRVEKLQCIELANSLERAVRSSSVSSRWLFGDFTVF